MKKSRDLFVLTAVSLLTGCASHPVGRYVTVSDSSTVIMTDTKTGQAWVTGLKAPGVLTDESFLKPKAQ
jgi:uncharacterized lipoprotein YmbA